MHRKQMIKVARNSQLLRSPEHYATASLNGKRRRLAKMVAAAERPLTPELAEREAALQAILDELARRGENSDYEGEDDAPAVRDFEPVGYPSLPAPVKPAPKRTRK
jgi:hypothetical protein